MTDQDRALLIVVDYQYDFVALDGALPVGQDALDIEEYIDARCQSYLDAGQDVAFTFDTHLRETWAAHPESKAFPPHCIKGTKGWEIYGLPARHLARSNAAVVEKAAYCPSFAQLEAWVKQYQRIEILGVVTNICVLHLAVGLYTAKIALELPLLAQGQPGARLVVNDAGCASFDPEAAQFALNHMHTVLGMTH